MRPGQNKRMRGRNNNRKGPNPLTRAYELNGPDVKIRGTAQHIAEKYLQLARDAQSSGDTVVAESYLQHAEHYIRIIAAAQTAQQQAQLGYGRGGDDVDETDEDDDFVALPDRFSSPFERAVPTPPLNPPQPNVAPMGFSGQPQPYFDRPAFAPESSERTGERAERPERSGERNPNSHGERQDRQPRNDRRFNNQQGQGRTGYREQQARFENAPPAQEQPRVNFDAVNPGLPAFITAPTRTSVPAAPSAANGAVNAPPNPEGGDFAGPQAQDDADGRFHLRPRRRRRTRAEIGDEQENSPPVAEANPADAE